MTNKIVCEVFKQDLFLLTGCLRNFRIIMYCLHLSVKKYLKPSQFKEKYAYELPKIYQPHFKQDTVSVLDFGAIADGYTLNTAAINSAIESCENV